MRARIGGSEVTVVCEGWAPMKLTDECPGRAVDWAREQESFPWAFSGKTLWQWHVHAFTIRTSAGTVLVDAGVGSFGPYAPWAEDHGSSAWEGLDPNEVSHVVLTHLHADHAGGGVSSEGEPRFPNATYHVHPGDWEHFGGGADEDGYDARRAMAGLERLGIVDLDGEDREILPGVRVIHTPGHTPGHRSVLLTDSNESLLLTGDLLHLPIQVAHPGWHSSHDVDPAVGSKSREELLRTARDERWLVGVSHFARPFGRVGAVSWEAAGWS
jgi:glyoxylase-like metal-dependent hydrolase (beta-lactamase superfamily II)